MLYSRIQYHPRTTLVSAFGWVMLVMGVLMTLTLLLNLVFMVILSQQSGEPLFPLEELGEVPGYVSWILENIIEVLILMLISALTMASAGFGVIRRREWGRQLSIILLALSIAQTAVGTIAGLAGMDEYLNSLSGVAGPIFLAINLGSLLLAAALHGWLIWKLRTVKIRGEFVESPAESF